jgi:CRISPR-associated protein Cst1
MSDTVRYVGDPFVDAGVAVLEHRVEKPHAHFTNADLVAQAVWLTEVYSQKLWAGYLTVHFPNSGWCNATMSSENKLAFRRNVLSGFELSVLDRPCSYCSRPAQKLADRSLIPLLTGATTMVAGPGGVPGLPVCGYCLYAIQFYPLATLKVEGKPLFWWSADPRWLYCLTEEFLSVASTVLAASSDSLLSLRWPSTRLLDAAWRTFNRVLEAGEQIPLADVIGCHATNYGSGPDYEEIRIPRALLGFWQEARSFSFYSDVVRSNWEAKTEKSSAKGTALQANIPDWQRRNLFYEDLGRLFRNREMPHTAFGLAKKYFMRLRAPDEERSFQLTRLFLERMTDMTRERLDAIERLATSIAESSKWKDSVDRLFRARDVIRALVDIQDRLLRTKEGALTTADVYQAFDILSDYDTTARDSGFVRDLLLLKILELRGESAIPEDVQENA